MQPTLALACGERWKIRMRARVASSGRFHQPLFAVALAGLKILVTSPPPSTCAPPGPWQPSLFTPAWPCWRCQARCADCPQTSWPHLRGRWRKHRHPHRCSEPRSWPGDTAACTLHRPWALRAKRGCAEYARAQHQHQQARSPRHFTGAAPIDKCVTGPALCMKNTALCDLIAISENSWFSFRFAASQNPSEKPLIRSRKPSGRSGSCSLCGASLNGLHPNQLFCSFGDLRHTRCSLPNPGPDFLFQGEINLLPDPATQVKRW